MKPVKTIAAVGVAAETLQELQDAIAASAERLDSEWRWGSEQNPDLLVVDPSEFAARMARTRAQVTGVRYVVVGDAAKHATDRFVLLQPFRKDAVAAVLNAAGSGTVAAPDFVRHDDGFYSTDFDAPEPAADASAHLEFPDTRAPNQVPGAAQGLDEMIRGDPLSGPAPDPTAVKIPVDATVDSTGAATQRTLARREQSWDRTRTSTGDTGTSERPGDPPAAAPLSGGGDGNASHPLARYLDGELLGGPARIALEDAPALVVDPKQRLFHALGDLPSLAPYRSRALRRNEWRALTSAELAEARAAAPGRPYQDLLWLDALLRSEGRLAPHLDPGGSYRVSRSIDVAADFHAHGAIAAAMSQPARLHEIAAAAGTPMDRVFDIVNAYEAVGLLQWTPRPPRHAPAPPPSKPRGLLARIRQRLRRR